MPAIERDETAAATFELKRARVTRKRPDWLVPLDDPRDEAILSAAFDLFAEKGFHGTTMLEIACRARASKKTLYARFQDKADLFRALLAWGCRRNLPGALPAPEANARQALRQHALAVLRAMMRPESIALLRIVAAEAQRFPETGQLFDRMTREVSARIVEELARRLKVKDPEGFSADFIALLRGDDYFRVLIGALPVPSDAALQAQARRAIDRLFKAWSV